MAPPPPPDRLISTREVGAHNSPSDLWLVVDGLVYDLTEFAPSHPGGSQVLHRFAGRDASRAYAAVHAPSLIRSFATPLGKLDEATVTPQWRAAAASSDAEEEEQEAEEAKEREQKRPPLAEIVNLHDFERAAEATLPAQAWAYLSAGSNDCITRDANQDLLQKIWLRPAVLRDVSDSKTDLSTTLFGCKLSMPIYSAPTGTTRTGGAEGELAVAGGCAAAGIVPVISTVASFPYEEILEKLPEDGSGNAYFQLYVDRDRGRAAALLRDLLTGPQGRKVRALFVTVDLPVVSKREADERARAAAARKRGEEPPAARLGQGGIAKQTGSFIDAAFTWADLPWLRGVLDRAVAEREGTQRPSSPLPIVVKGVQRAADARAALAAGCQGIVVSNHGGRAADTAPPAILTLLELHRCCPEVFGRLEILVDGGFRRGSDVVKAICLGASAVGVGRPFVYAVGYGRPGVEHAAAILRDEIQTAMQLCGLSNLMRDADPSFVNTGAIDHMVPTGFNHPYAKKPVLPAKL